MLQELKKWFDTGAPWVWLNASAVSISVIMVVGLLLLILVRGMGHFWPAAIIEANYIEDNGQEIRLAGEIHATETVPAVRLRSAGISLEGQDAAEFARHLLKVGNRDVSGRDFRWVLDYRMKDRHFPESIAVLERREWGDMYGYIKQLDYQGQSISDESKLWPALRERIAESLAIHDQIKSIEKDDIGAINYKMERLRLQERRLELDGQLDDQHKAELQAEHDVLQQQYQQQQDRLTVLHEKSNQGQLTVKLADGQSASVPIANIIRVYQPNDMSLLQKFGFYFSKIWEFVSEEPREANTEGGIFPAIFGTVMMVILMTVFVTPFGVIAAIYLREYAKQGVLTRVIRIAVNNLAGVPSIVYGVFGLGFFVYFLGGNIDRLFFPEALPSPTMGTPGILWASLTLAILTVPVVIVATEEGLARIPRSIHEGSLALGATKFETLWRTLLPMASPAMMTGLILAVARAAGEVAPLMLVGVVKLAPSLPLDGNFPFLHLDRKFMHLGFHIYDVGFQSPNVEAARPLVYATALLLVLVIAALNITAITIRNRLREKYRTLEG
jgi:phosphate transport system permease protein